MVDVNEVMLRIKEWFETGEEDAEDIVKAPWEVDVYKDDKGNIVGIKAVNPRFPIYFLAKPLERSVRIAAFLGYPTATLETEKRLRAYRYALLVNTRLELAKVVFHGDDEDLVVCVDLDMKSLGEEEFDDALSMIYAGIAVLADKLGIEEQLKAQILFTMANLVARKLSEGYTKEQLYTFLTRRAGMPEDMANKIIDMAYRKSETPSYIG